MVPPWRLSRVVAILLAAWPVAVGGLFWLWMFDHRTERLLRSEPLGDHTPIALLVGPLLLLVGVVREDLRLATAGILTFFVLTFVFGIRYGFLLQVSAPAVVAAYLVSILSQGDERGPASEP